MYIRIYALYAFHCIDLPYHTHIITFTITCPIIIFTIIATYFIVICRDGDGESAVGRAVEQVLYGQVSELCVSVYVCEREGVCICVCVCVCVYICVCVYAYVCVCV